jgi:pimeloyl-ACP methyl ester carboxylesterase
VQKILPLLEKEVETTSGKPRHLTVLGESFGGCLAIRLAQAAPHIVSRLVLVRGCPGSLTEFALSTLLKMLENVLSILQALHIFGLGQINPATNFAESNAIASFAARTGLLAAFPEPLYQVAQVWLEIPAFP